MVHLPTIADVPDPSRPDASANPAIDPVVAATARPAATVVIVRDGDERADGSLEVLLLKRSEVGAFPGMWVFPGGRVDDTDDGADEIGRARSAAAREAAEEVGLEVRAAELVAWSHWSPPTQQPKRFLTWFFVTTWTGSPVVIDDHEIVDHQWFSPIRGITSGLALAPPTYVTLHQLTQRRTVAEVLGSGPPFGVERFVTRPGRAGDRHVLLWHGDAGYDTGDASIDGPRHRATLHGMRLVTYERTGGHIGERPGFGSGAR